MHVWSFSASGTKQEHIPPLPGSLQSEPQPFSIISSKGHPVKHFSLLSKLLAPCLPATSSQTHTHSSASTGAQVSALASSPKTRLFLHGLILIDLTCSSDQSCSFSYFHCKELIYHLLIPWIKNDYHTYVACSWDPVPNLLTTPVEGLRLAWEEGGKEWCWEILETLGDLREDGLIGLSPLVLEVPLERSRRGEGRRWWWTGMPMLP